MTWQKVLPFFIILCIVTVGILLVYQKMSTMVILIAPPHREIMDRNADTIANGTFKLQVDNIIRQSMQIHNKTHNVKKQNENNDVKEFNKTDKTKEFHKTNKLEQFDKNNEVKEPVKSSPAGILHNVRLNAAKQGLPLLTLFTTLRDQPERFHIHSNVLKNWAVFQPYIIPVLFTANTNSELVKLAKQLGWEILPVPKKNQFGTPYLKPMFSAAKQKYKSIFYGYSNGDLLFEYGLVDTLKSVTGCLEELKRTMIIGRRTNYKASNDKPLFKPEDVKKISQNGGKLFRFDAEDYFFIANSDFPWNKVPDIVIGRPAYDNFLVATAWKSGVSVVDATTTLLALHQTGKDGDYAGHHNSKDTGHNYKVIGKFNYGLGLTKNAQFETKYDSNNEVEIWHRISKSNPRSYKVKSDINKFMQTIRPKELSQSVHNDKHSIKMS